MSKDKFEKGDLVEFKEDFNNSTLAEVMYSSKKRIELYILLSDDKSLEGATAYPDHDDIRHASDEILEKYKEYI